ncbi:MAG: hypothetical protein AAF252_02910 [Pseudomonadota bacterium]
MKRAISLVATVATLSVASAAAAMEHTVMILPDAYFPQVTYLKAGDSVRFVNASGVQHSIVAAGSDWTLGPIPNEGEAVLEVSNVIEKTFFNQDAVDGDGNLIVQGEISFETAPLN